MRHQHEANQRYQAGAKEARSHIDAEKSRGVHPPRTVGEEVRDMTTAGEDGEHRRRDPLKAAQRQSEPRAYDGSDGAIMSSAEGAGADTEDLDPEEYRDDVQ